ncbi:MAG: hypothetical protein ACPLKV_02260 [Minisyncoccia bacterium]
MNQPIPTTPPLPNQKSKRKHLLLIVISVLAVVIFVLFGIGGGFSILKERVQMVIDMYRVRKATEQFYKGLEQYYQVFREDTYGGKTPQETLNMFIEALEKGDIDLAAKYFAMDENQSRKKWEDALKIQVEKGKLQELINLTKQFKPSPIQSPLTTTYEFVIMGKDGMADYIMQMELNEYSGVWKIKSM